MSTPTEKISPRKALAKRELINLGREVHRLFNRARRKIHSKYKWDNYHKSLREYNAKIESQSANNMSNIEL